MKRWRHVESNEWLIKETKPNCEPIKERLRSIIRVIMPLRFVHALLSEAGGVIAARSLCPPPPSTTCLRRGLARRALSLPAHRNHVTPRPIGRCDGVTASVTQRADLCHFSRRRARNALLIARRPPNYAARRLNARRESAAKNNGRLTG